MAEYVDREALIECLEHSPMFSNFKDGGFFLKNGVIGIIQKQPKADVAEVVRCKECRYCWERRTKRYKNLMRFCMKRDGIEYQVNANDYCSYGRKKG